VEVLKWLWIKNPSSILSANTKPFKIWMDGMGPFPSVFHPGLRLEDKWNQYLLIHPMIAIPETMIFDPHHLPEAERFLEQEGPLVLKRRLGRGGRELQRISDSQAFMTVNPDWKDCLLQKYVESTAMESGKRAAQAALDGADPIEEILIPVMR